MKPIVGLTSQSEHQINRKINKVNNTYIQSVIENGGIPVVIPVLQDIEDINRYIDIIDGIIFTGGEDVSSLYFSEEPIREVSHIDRDRDKMELELFKEAYDRDMPILGICRGVQLINIALGGSLYQDIYKAVPEAIGHTCGHNIQEGHHTIEVDRDSILYEVYGEEKLLVNSLHHQAVKDLGKNLRVTSRAVDGIIESIESTEDKIIFGVQFHPEAMGTKYKEYNGIFKYFIDKCK